VTSDVVRRRSGISVVGELPWGSHFCQFYRTKKDMTDIVVPYFRAGLESDELCIWVTSDFLTTEDALEALHDGVPGCEEYLARKQIEVLPHTDWYLKGGSFDLQRTLDMWMAKHEEALLRGYAGLRVSGTPYWIEDKKDWDDFAAYEAAINRVIGGTRLLVLCTYSLQKCGVAEILDVVRNHEFAVAMNQGTWQVVTMPARSTAT
jgi:MEDS: MEthanogen/methylotroph, DcmR Sensory domain